MEKHTTLAAEELSRAEFNDKRLSKRLSFLVEEISKNPSASFPAIADSVSALEATYRFLGNPKVSAERVLAPHVAATLARACGEQRVVVAHDTTDFSLEERVGEPRSGF